MTSKSNFFAVSAAIAFAVSLVFAVVVLKRTSFRRHVPNTEPAADTAAVEPARAEAPLASLRALPPPQTSVATPRPGASQETELGAVDPPPAEPEPQAESRPFEQQR